VCVCVCVSVLLWSQGAANGEGDGALDRKALGRAAR